MLIRHCDLCKQPYGENLAYCETKDISYFIIEQTFRVYNQEDEMEEKDICLECLKELLK